MKLSVVIPCRNAARTIGDTLGALAQQSWPDEWEVIVADNCSTDALAGELDRHKSKIASLRLIEASAMRGPSYARNVGVRASTGECILFCDADDVPSPGCAWAMAEGLKTYPFVACRLDFEKLNAPSIRVARGHTQGGALQRFPFLPFSHAGAGTLGIRRSVHEAIGGFDETMPICEDIDYCMRAQKTGARFTLSMRFVCTRGMGPPHFGNVALAAICPSLVVLAGTLAGAAAHARGKDYVSLATRSTSWTSEGEPAICRIACDCRVKALMQHHPIRAFP